MDHLQQPPAGPAPGHSSGAGNGGAARIRRRLGWALFAALIHAPGVWAEAAAAADKPAYENPWAFNLSLYMWLPGLDGSFSAGPLSRSVDYSFVDIAGKLRNVPLAFMGRFEAHYERLGFYLDGNYIDMDFRPRLDESISKGLSTQLSIMDYGAMYRLFGATPSERIGHWDKQSRSNILDLYVGGRTIWLDNQIQFQGIRSASVSKSLTAPVLGGRFMVEFSPEWFLLMDGNAGGFGVDEVSFTGTLLGMVGYRTTLFGMPASIEGGFKALRVDISKQVSETTATMSGPFLGLTGFW
ncbi:MAG: hypothetical protein AB1648_05210 [Pseudomonadota bacterium]